MTANKRTIRAAVFRGQQVVSVEDIDASLQGMQAIVGGYIEQVRLTDTLTLVCDEEGLLKRKPLQHVVNAQGRAVPIVGDFFIVRDEGGEEWVSIRPEDVARIAAAIIQ